MIPKTIHYCWFGRGEKPAKVLYCIASWKKHLPDWTFVEWNEDNFDFSAWPYAVEAYERKKYAFVSDIARLYALYNEGGVYLDTDVELLQPLEPFLEHPAFGGYEQGKYLTTGLLGAEKGSTLVKELLGIYEGKHYIQPDGSEDLTTNVRRITDYMVSAHAFPKDDAFLVIDGVISVYPSEVFSPLDPKSRKLRRTGKTVAIHHYLASWEPRTPVYVFRKMVVNTFGLKAYERLRALKLKIFPKPWI